MPAVVSLMVTGCVAVNIPVPGENVGVGSTGAIMKVPATAELLPQPLLTAMTFKVFDALNQSGPPYCVDEVVGVVPSVV